MDCSEFQAIVAGERADDLSSAESEGFEAHLESCVPCRESVSRAEEDLERLSALADPPLLAASVWARVDEAVRLQARKRPGREQPFSVGPLEEAPVPVATSPAMPVTLARPALVRGSPVKLAFVAMAAALVMMFTFLAVNAPSRPRDPGEVVIRVKPLEDGDVKSSDVRVGESFKKLKEQGRLIIITPGD